EAVAHAVSAAIVTTIAATTAAAEPGNEAAFVRVLLHERGKVEVLVGDQDDEAVRRVRGHGKGDGPGTAVEAVGVGGVGVVGSNERAGARPLLDAPCRVIGGEVDVAGRIDRDAAGFVELAGSAVRSR